MTSKGTAKNRRDVFSFLSGRSLLSGWGHSLSLPFRWCRQLLLPLSVVVAAVTVVVVSVVE